MNRNKMNKRANLYLNIYRPIVFILCLSCMGLAITLHEVTFKIPFLLNNLVILIGFISGVLFLGIEVFLFFIYNKKGKILYFTYMIIDLILILTFNMIFPFSGFIILITLSLLKDFLRVKLVDKIYDGKEFKRYCKMFNIKVSDFRKKRVSSKVTTNQEIIEIKEETVVEPKSKSKKKKTVTATN